MISQYLTRVIPFGLLMIWLFVLLAAFSPTNAQDNPSLTSPRFGLSLTYPAGWLVSENPGLIDLLNPAHTEESIEGLLMAGISIKLFDNASQRTLEDFARLMFDHAVTIGITDNEPLQITPLSLNNPHLSRAVLVQGIPSATSDYYILVAYEFRVYVFGLNTDFLVDAESYQAQYNQLLRDVLQSLQFSPADWSGYQLEAPVSVSADRVADQFSYPVADPNVTNWRILQPFNNFFDNPRYNSYHAAEDWYQRGGPTAGEPVFAVADGVVKYASAANYPGDVVIVEHLLPNGETWYSMYGHLGLHFVGQGANVARGDRIGTVYDWPGNQHLHFEIRNFFLENEINGSESALERHRNYPPGPGYWPVGRFRETEERPPDRGWVAPSTFIDNHARQIPSSAEAIFGRVALQGQPTSSGSQITLSTAPCTPPEITDSAVIKQMITTTDASGYFELLPEAEVTYQCLEIKQPGFLSAQYESPPIGNLGAITLLNGDLNHDNRINIFDLTLIAQHYETTQAGFDLNLDDQVNILDLAMAANNYGQVGPLTEWE